MSEETKIEDEGDRMCYKCLERKFELEMRSSVSKMVWAVVVIITILGFLVAWSIR